jgi:hypothetical protein
MFSIWYCSGHCSGSYVQYLVLLRTMQWLVCSVSGIARDITVALIFSIWYRSGHCSGCNVQYLVLRGPLLAGCYVQFTLTSPICVLSSCPIAVLKFCIFCTPVYAVEGTQFAHRFLEPAHSDCVV